MDSNLQIHKTKIPSTFEWLAIVNHAHLHTDISHLVILKIIISSDCWKKLVSIVFLETRRHKKSDSKVTKIDAHTTNRVRKKRAQTVKDANVYIVRLKVGFTLAILFMCIQYVESEIRNHAHSSAHRLNKNIEENEDRKKSGNRDTIPMQYLHSYTLYAWIFFLNGKL